MLSGVGIELFTDPNGDGDPSDGVSVGTTTTDGNGDYNFTNLTPGDYIAVETQPAGLDDVSENEGGADNDKPDNGILNSIAGTVDAGENDANNDFVEEQLGSWNGNVSEDINNDGIGDNPISGVTIRLFTDPNGDGNPSDGVLVGTTTTDTNGNYSFTELVSGDYVAMETQPSNYLDVSENEGGSDNDKPDNGTINSIAGTVDVGETDLHNDFVEEQLGSWSGNVSKDTNSDGIGDVNLAGVIIKLYRDTNGDGRLDGSPIATTTTNSSGNYNFTNLTPGDYVAVETQPAGLLNVSENEGGADNDKPNNGILNSIAGTVSPNENDANNDFVEENGVFDLALIKRINTSLTPGSYIPRHAVVYKITIVNQGTLDATNVQISDFIPAGLSLSDFRWRKSGSVATLKTPIARIAAGASVSVDIIFRIDANIHSTNIVNNAEIKSASNILGISDRDSTPNSGIGTDDYDTAKINVKCSCQVCIACGRTPTLTLEVSDITANSAQLEWNYSANSDGFEIYSNGQFVTYVNANTSSYKLTNLKGKTEYTVKVITVLGDGGDIYKTVRFKTGDNYGWLPAIYHMLMH